MAREKIPTLQAEYTDKVKIQVILPIAAVDKFKADKTEATNGRAKIEVTENLYYAILNGKVLMGEDLRGE